MKESEQRVQKLILVFNADSGTWNAVMDSARKAVGQSECPLCDITHGLMGEKREWRRLRRDLGVPIEYVHRDEISEDLVPVVTGRLPAVVVATAQGLQVLLPPEVLARCRGSVGDFRGRLMTHVELHGLKLGGDA